MFERKESISLGACEVSPGIHTARHRFNKKEQMGQNAKKFLKKGNSKRGLLRFLGNPYAHRTVMDATDKPGFRC